MNKQIAVITLLLAVVISAYEFNDPVFNQILAADLEELHENADRLPRSKRDEEAVEKCKPGGFRRKKLCCAEETFESVHERYKDLKRECFRNVSNKDRGEIDPFRCDKVERHRRQMTCVLQCVGQKNNLLDADGNPNQVEFEAFVRATMSKESWFASIQDKVIPACLAEARNATANRDTSDTESCNPAGVKLMHCLFREIQLGCPAEQIKDQKACTKLRDRIKRQDYLPPPTPFLHEE